MFPAAAPQPLNVDPTSSLVHGRGAGVGAGDGVGDALRGDQGITPLDGLGCGASAAEASPHAAASAAAQRAVTSRLRTMRRPYVRLSGDTTEYFGVSVTPAL